MTRVRIDADGQGSRVGTDSDLTSTDTDRAVWTLMSADVSGADGPSPIQHLRVQVRVRGCTHACINVHVCARACATHWPAHGSLDSSGCCLDSGAADEAFRSA